MGVVEREPLVEPALSFLYPRHLTGLRLAGVGAAHPCPDPRGVTFPSSAGNLRLCLQSCVPVWGTGNSVGEQILRGLGRVVSAGQAVIPGP